MYIASDIIMINDLCCGSYVTCTNRQWQTLT